MSLQLFSKRFSANFFCIALLLGLLGIPTQASAQAVKRARVTTQPISQVAELNQTIVFSVAAQSTAPLTYQWRRNRVNIPDATSATYTIDAALPEHIGIYDVLVTNAGGQVASRPARLIVNIAPQSLPLNTLIEGSFVFRAVGEIETSEGSYLVTGPGIFQDLESPSDPYTFTYRRRNSTSGSLTIKGFFYDSSVGTIIEVNETWRITFTSVESDGKIAASVITGGSFSLPAGFRAPSIKFKGTGTITLSTVVGE